MKQILFLIFYALFFLTSCASCGKKNDLKPGTSDIVNHNDPDTTKNKMKIKIGSSTFTATLYDNNTVVAFKSLLPLTVNMVELNGNEKYIDLSRSLPTNTLNPGTIQAGDLMIYGSSTLVLFYKTFSTSYSYTRLGKIDDITGLAAAVGSGNVTVIFQLQ
ncbi:MAG TPA: cyclophilin-like fold protein [Niastella sp.]